MVTKENLYREIKMNRNLARKLQKEIDDGKKYEIIDAWKEKLNKEVIRSLYVEISIYQKLIDNYCKDE